MKIKIRKSVFETNSSSMHSLVIKKDGGYYSPEEIRDDIWIDNTGEWNLAWGDELVFGCSPFNCLCTFGGKTRYAIASLCSPKVIAADNLGDKDKFDEIKEIFMKYVPECKKIKLREDSEFTYGWVDEDILTRFLDDENISLEEFLTNKKYVVIVDGDEYLIWDALKQSGLVDLNKIEKESN